MKNLMLVLFLVSICGLGNSSAQKLSLPFTGNTVDSSGHNHDAIIIGNVGMSNDRFGDANKAYHFPGTAHDFMFVPEDWNTMDFIIQWPDSFSVSLWMQPENSSYQGLVFSRRDTNWLSNHASDYSIEIGQGMISSSLGMYYFGDASDYYSANPVKWYHVVLTYADSVANLYVNDTLRNTNAYAAIDSAGTGLVIGQYFKGEIDDINYYNRVLDANDVHALFRMGTATGLAENPVSKKSFALSPNPANEFVTVSNSRNETISVEIYNSLGEIVKTEKADSDLKIYLADLKDGIYFVRINGSISQSTEKLILQRGK